MPQTARIWSYWLGGKDNYAVDRQVGGQIKAAFPHTVELARASRAFLGRAVRYLAGEVGVRQFIDVGTGLPTLDLDQPGGGHAAGSPRAHGYVRAGANQDEARRPRLAAVQ